MTRINPNTVDAREGLAVGEYSIYRIADIAHLERVADGAKELAATCEKRIAALEREIDHAKILLGQDRAESLPDAINRLVAENDGLREQARQLKVHRTVATPPVLEGE